jgi:multiple sugar transport system substrate-binding protein
MHQKQTQQPFWLPFVAILAVWVLLAACAPAGTAPDTVPPPTPPPAGDPQAVPVVEDEIVLRMAWWGGLERNEIYNAIADLYEQQNPHIEILREYAGWGDYWTRTATQAAGGNLPCITASVIDTLTEYAQRGAYAPLDPFVEAGNIDLSGWDPTVLEGTRVDGNLYMIPTGVTVNAIVVNEDLIRRVGMEPPPFELTYDEYAAYVRELQANLPDDVWATTNAAGYSEHFQSWVLQNGYQIANENATDVGFPPEVMIEFFEYWYDLYNDGVVLPIEISSQPLGDPWADSFLATGRVAMQWTNSNQLKIYQLYTDDNLVLVRNPMMPDGENEAGEYLRASALSIAANCEHPEEAARFINWFVNDVEAATIFNMELGAVGPEHVQEALRETINPKDVLVLDHFNAVLQDIPEKVPDPRGTAAVLAAHRRANEAIAYGTPIEQAVEVFFNEAQEAYSANR